MQAQYFNSCFDEFCYYAVMDDNDNFFIVRRRLNGYYCKCGIPNCQHIQFIKEKFFTIKQEVQND